MEGEEELGVLVKNLCTRKDAGGKWVAKMNIISTSEAGDNAPQLAVQKEDKPGLCRKECRTVQQACRKALSGKDDTIVSLLRDSAGLSNFQDQVCERSCEQKSFPKLGNWNDEEFEEN